MSYLVSALLFAITGLCGVFAVYGGWQFLAFGLVSGSCGVAYAFHAWTGRRVPTALKLAAIALIVIAVAVAVFAFRALSRIH